MTLADEKYLLFTTFRTTGEAVSTPVWAVPLSEGRVGFYTSSGTGKAKRLAHTSKVRVQPCDARGRVKAGTEPVDATAELVTGAELDDIVEKIKAKYGFFTNVTKLLGTIGGIVKRNRIPYADRGVVITLTG
ncbi:MAG: PPOX class F420-dependent oxidoreductase [Acidimicrobiales bacterium]|nr:MAG: PPOX class F420-dependent oxidoreductase [Acidimicrobiales bacterium]